MLAICYNFLPLFKNEIVPHQESKRDESTCCRLSRERCSMVVVTALLFLAATAVATMLTTKAVR